MTNTSTHGLPPTTSGCDTTVTAPSSVNFTALDTRLSRICLKRLVSVWTHGSRSGLDGADQRDLLALRDRPDHLQDLVDHLADIGVVLVDLETTGFHPRQVEQIVEHGRQTVGGVLDARHQFAGARIQWSLQQEVDHADDPGHRVCAHRG